MEIFDTLIKIIDENFVYSLFPLIFTIILIEVIFKNRFKTKQALNLIKWFIIAYTILTIVYFLLGIIIFPYKFFIFINRATGPYKLVIWLMFLSATILPFTLFYKKLAVKPFYLLFVAVFMKIGWYFEHFVIIVTSYHSDYSPNIESNNWFIFPIERILVLFFQGFILGIILLGIFELFDKYSHKKLDLS